ncbi:hypothetical protein B0T20DRAFT_463398 [Sordaria brevicollis]|uniref:Uncharacterized protein n=1 Tax=Sordaria brevicollis TaxID=83679 RepID=A0AAE0P9F8_SORBR|nr:hypothetical protein B0T20DRAFT_463398 [Sordaria brevicollis]
MSHSKYFKAMFERMHEGQPHYTRKWAVKDAKPTGLTDAQRRIAAPPDNGEPAAALYAFLDITQYKPDWQPVAVEIMTRLDNNLEYVQLDNGFWYLLEEDGSYKHMTDAQFKDFLKWKAEKDADAKKEGARDPDETESDESEYVADFEDHDSDDEMITPDSSVELIDPELDKLNFEKDDSS